VIGFDSLLVDIRLSTRAGEDQDGGHPRVVAHLDVGLQAVADHETVRRVDAHRLGRGLCHLRSGLADDGRFRAGHPLDGPDSRARAGDYLLTADGVGTIGVRRDEGRLGVERGEHVVEQGLVQIGFAARDDDVGRPRVGRFRLGVGVVGSGDVGRGDPRGVEFGGDRLLAHHEGLGVGVFVGEVLGGR
jgi:hypothetical protein